MSSRPTDLRIFAISGSGNGAGKSTMAKKTADEVLSLAHALRQDLSQVYPTYDWFNKSQAYKDYTLVPEAAEPGKDLPTVRDVLIKHGQDCCKDDPVYWVRKLCDNLDKYPTKLSVVAIDDIRKLVEIEYLKNRFPGNITHFHIKTPRSVYEPQFQNDELEAVADYVVNWK